MQRIVVNMSGFHVEERLEADANVDLSALEGTNCYCDADAAAAIRKAVADLPLEAVHFIDTGDYHYLSRFWLEKAAELGPFALVLFDHHPDMQEPAFGGVISCGGWARDSFTSMENLQQVLMMGINPDLELEFLDLVFDGVLAVTTDDLRGGTLKGDALEMISLLEPRIPVYFSIDLDALATEHARTNWDQGCMSLEQMEACIRMIASSHKVLGVDICGGLTREKGASDADFELNRQTGERLAALFD